MTTTLTQGAAVARDHRVPQGGRRKSTAFRETIAGYAFLSPALVLFIIFIAGPFLVTIGLAFFNWSLLGPASFAGFRNFVHLVHDPILLQAVGNTFIFAFSSVVTHVGFGMLLAIAANRRMGRFARTWLRVSVFLPFLISWAAVSLLWKYILDPNFGFISAYLKQIGINTPNWLLDPGWAMFSIIWVDWWHTIGYTFVILLAGLQTVPVEFHEAAMIDGAGAFRRFWYITIPTMSPTLFFVLVITFAGAFQIFEPMYILTTGGPSNSTLSVVMYVYRQAFQRFNIGYGSAVSIVFFVIIALVTAIQFRLSRRWVTQ